MKDRVFIFIISILLIVGCKDNSTSTPVLVENQNTNIETVRETTMHDHAHAKTPPPTPSNHPKGWVEIVDQLGIVNDIRYATTNNFVGEKMYECGRCYLTSKAAAQLMMAHEELQLKGLGLKMYDCYRPKPVQQKLWDKTPNPSYVTPPWKGSMHNRGLAIDLTIIDSLGNELDMGTEYDYFGREAHYDNQDLPKQVLRNRKMLRTIMEHYGFEGIRTEWWHFSLPEDRSVAEWEWECD